MRAAQSNHENHGRSPGLIRRESSVPGSIRNCEIERPKRSRRARDSSGSRHMRARWSVRPAAHRHRSHRHRHFRGRDPGAACRVVRGVLPPLPMTIIEKVHAGVAVPLGGAEAVVPEFLGALRVGAVPPRDVDGALLLLGRRNRGRSGGCLGQRFDCGEIGRGRRLAPLAFGVDVREQLLKRMPPIAPLLNLEVEPAPGVEKGRSLDG